MEDDLNKIIWANIPDEFVVFDTETTGLNPKTDTILEIGAVIFKKDDYITTGEVTTFQTLIKQNKPIPPEATAINKITDEMVIDGKTDYDALDSFFDFVGARDLYAYNAKFDKDFINETSKRCGYSKGLILHEVYDICEFVRENWVIKPNYRLVTVAKNFGLEVKGNHRAVKDSVLALSCFVQVHQRIVAAEYHYKRSNRFVPPTVNEGSDLIKTYKTNNKKNGGITELKEKKYDPDTLIFGGLILFFICIIALIKYK